MADEAAIREQLVLHVDRLAGLIGPRHLGKPSSIQATIGYITGQWSVMGCEVRREEYEAQEHTATNLFIEQQGNSRPDEIVLLGAHYDTVFQSPGANDNPPCWVGVCCGLCARGLVSPRGGVLGGLAAARGTSCDLRV